jgi:LPXTG-site transpeptidase (sortase) family protein
MEGLVDESIQKTRKHQPPRVGAKVALVVLGVLLFSGLFFYPLLVGQAEAYFNLNEASAPTFTDTATATATSTATATATATSTATSTDTPTATASPTVTITPTKTGTLPTSTLTSTPTATGTLSPNPTLIVKVKPTEAYIGQKFTFDIIIGNTGSGPLTEVVIADSFPSYILVETVASQRGVVNRAQHSFTVSVGYVNPGETINITAVVKVTSGALVTETLTNVVTMTYAPNKSKTASVTYKAIASALPGTGGLPALREASPPIPRADLTQSLLTGLLGAILLVYGLWARKREPRSAQWMSVAGVFLLALALVSGLSTSGILTPTPSQPMAEVPVQPVTQGEPSSGEAQVVADPALHPRAADFSTPEAIPVVTLPVYPIPSPVVSITPDPGEREPDTTAIQRIVIPYLLVDNVVAYIPYDGNTWLISGLTQEVAWLGDTSWPGLGSNTGLAAHVTVTGQGDGPFRYLDTLPAGELVFLYTEENMYTYSVRERTVVPYDAMYVTEGTENPQITLITCANWSEADVAWLDRLIVYADLVRSDPILRTGSN